MSHRENRVFIQIQLIGLSIGLIVLSTSSAHALEFALKGGLLLSGEGEFDFVSLCEDSGAADGQCEELNLQLSTDAEDTSGFSLMVEGSGEVFKQLHIGTGLMFVTKTELKGEGDAEEYGSDLTLYGLLAYSIPVNQGVEFKLRGLGGLLIVLPGGFLNDLINTAKANCDNAPSAINCDVDLLPLGWSAGAGGGVSFDLGKVLLSADFLYQYISVDMFHQEVSVSDATGSLSADQTLNYSGTRAWLMFGISFKKAIPSR